MIYETFYSRILPANSKENETSFNQRNPSEQDLRSRILEIALRYVGYPTIEYTGLDSGISPETGFNCSGFIYFVLRQSGIAIPSYLTPGETLPRPVRHVNEMFDHLGVLVHWGQQKPADLVFFTKKTGMLPRHVGIVIDDSHYIHAPSRTGRVLVDELRQTPVESPEKGALYNINPIGFKRLVIPCPGDCRWPQKIL